MSAGRDLHLWKARTKAEAGTCPHALTHLGASPCLSRQIGEQARRHHDCSARASAPIPVGLGKMMAVKHFKQLRMVCIGFCEGTVETNITGKADQSTATLGPSALTAE